MIRTRRSMTGFTIPIVLFVLTRTKSKSTLNSRSFTLFVSVIVYVLRFVTSFTQILSSVLIVVVFYVGGGCGK